MQPILARKAPEIAEALGSSASHAASFSRQANMVHDARAVVGDGSATCIQTKQAEGGGPEFSSYQSNLDGAFNPISQSQARWSLQESLVWWYSDARQAAKDF